MPCNTWSGACIVTGASVCMDAYIYGEFLSGNHGSVQDCSAQPTSCENSNNNEYSGKSYGVHESR
jgi:hypothetical protein